MVGKRLAEIRRLRGLSQSDLARQVDLSSQSINQIEHGKRQPSLDTAQKLAAVLKVSLDDLMASPGNPVRELQTAPVGA